MKYICPKAKKCHRPDLCGHGKIHDETPDCLKMRCKGSFCRPVPEPKRRAKTKRRGNWKTKQPRIVCLCGSTRFKDAFDEANYHETMRGHIVLSVGFFMHATGNKHGEGVGATPEQKIALDELHKRKIDLADEVLVLNVGGYIGDSTRSEIAYALAHNKLVKYLEETTDDN